MNAMNLDNKYNATLGELFADLHMPGVWASVNVRHLALDSRKVECGSLFFAVNGVKTKGEKFVHEAILSGATAIILEAEEGSIVLKRLRKEYPEIPILSDSDLLKKISKAASIFYKNPSLALCCVGITGTNGKSSCVHLISELWCLLGRRSASIGTLGYGMHGQEVIPKTNPGLSAVLKPGIPKKLSAIGMTTPDAISTQRIIAEMRDQNASHLAMEVSSHGIHQGRVSGVDFNVTGLTNVTRDHLDYHKSFAEYARVKSSFVETAENVTSVINIDDDEGLKVIAKRANKTNLIRYSLSNPQADVYASQRDLNNNGITARIISPWGSGILRTRLLGDFNLSNLLMCISTCCSSGENFQKVLTCIAKLSPAPGRMQQVLPEPVLQTNEIANDKQSIDHDSNAYSGTKTFSSNVTNLNTSGVKVDSEKRAYIDFAHTPDALEKAIVTLRQHTDKRLWVVFGCGGDRDVGKRSLMGEVAAQLCDHVVITSDNPRSEKPSDIIKQIAGGARAIISSDEFGSIHYSVSSVVDRNSKKDEHSKASTNRLVEIEDREAAIAYAINEAKKGDTVLIAGKGHEEFQIVGDKHYPFSDYDIASKYLKGANITGVHKATLDTQGGEHAPS